MFAFVFTAEVTQMRSTFIAIATLAASGLLATASARAEVLHHAGEPVQAGNQCWVSTNSDNGFGFWRDCPKPVSISKRKK